jgi:hypothetical protein
MWLAPFEPNMRTVDGQANRLIVDFGCEVAIGGLHVWNYNKSAEDATRGVRFLEVRVDGRHIGNYICRRAPGHCRFDFKQVLLLDQAQRPMAPLGTRPVREATPEAAGWIGQYEVPLQPCGFTWTLAISSTWGDRDFWGLNGLQFIGPDGQPVEATARVHSAHGSVNRLPGMSDDPRVVENLFDGENDTLDDTHMFLAPFLRKQVLERVQAGGEVTVGNCVEVVFDTPVTVAVLLIWNYAKTPARGAKDVEIFVDDRLIYRGSMRDVRQARSFQEAILFTDDPKLTAQFGPYVYLTDVAEELTMIDEGMEVTHADLPSRIDDEVQRQRPMTAVAGRRNVRSVP